MVDMDKLYLVDLGLCYYPETKDVTADMPLGPRRFLTLPEFEDEQQEAKRDPRSDVALCCAVFRWMLKGKDRDVGDSHLSTVHYSLFADREILSRLSDANWRVFAILEKGLSVRLEDRWTLDELLAEIQGTEISLVEPLGKANTVTSDHDILIGWLKEGLGGLKHGNLSKMSEFGSQASVAFSNQSRRGFTATLQQQGHILSLEVGNAGGVMKRPIVLIGLDIGLLPTIIETLARQFVTKEN